jgi:hypothetical protein
MWQLADLPFANPIFFVICGFDIRGHPCFCGIKPFANSQIHVLKGQYHKYHMNHFTPGA